MKNRINESGDTLKKHFTLKIRVLLFCALSLLTYKNNLFSQMVAQQQASTALLGNTGVALTGLNGLTMVSLTAGNDPRWTVNTTTVTGAPATIIPVPPSSTNCPTWSANGTGGGPSWITLPGLAGGSPPVPGNYVGSIPLTNSLYFKLTFTLIATPMFFIDWQLFASDYIQEIRVNGVPAYTIGALTTLPNQRQNPINFRWCTNWKVGANEIIVRVNTNSAFAPECKLIGLKVLAWGSNPAFYSTITGPGFPYILCTGASAQFIAATKASLGIPASSPVTYTWTKPSGWAGPPSTNNILNINSVGTLSGIVGVGILTLTSNGYQCLSTAGYSITVPPPLTITASSPTVCTGKSLTLTASGAATYAWYDPGNNYLANTNIVQITPTAGFSVYKVVGSNMGCTYTKTISINTFVTPALAVILNPTVICVGGTASLQVTGNAWQYKLLNPPGGIVIFPAPVSVLVGTNVTTAYTVQARSIPGCTNNSIISLSVVPNPTITIVATPSVICAGGISNLMASGANTYIWTTLGPGNPKSVSPVSTTIYTVAGYQGTCTASKTVQVNVLTSPIVNVNPPNVCPGITNTLTASGALSYNWIVGPPPLQYYNGVPSVTVNSTVPFNYTVVGVGPPPNNCSGTFTGTIPLGTPIPLSVPNVTLCTNAGPCTTLTASSSLTTNVTYTWMTLPPTTGTMAVVCPTMQTNYLVNANSTVAGCPSSSMITVSIATNCCSQSTAGLTPLNPLVGMGIGGTFVNTSYLLNASTTLTASTNFYNAEVLITPGVSITVPAGMVLNLDKTHLFACGIKMWQGIIVQDGGRITTPLINTRTDNCLIEDAVVAIDLGNISATNSGTNMPIDIYGVIFNRNYIGIKISNSVPSLNVLDLGISGCIFSSRSMTFTTFPASSLNWPSSACVNITTTMNGLRVVNNATAGLVPPYNLTGAQSNLKLPYNTQPGHIGIKIEKIGKPNGLIPYDGVKFSHTGTLADFNLFDGLGNGIDVTDASLTTRNNVFQNMKYYPVAPSFTNFGGIGIKHVITDLSNARLSLIGTLSPSDGNQFWNCNTGIFASNIYDFAVTYGLFRSTHTASMATFPSPMPGDTGISAYTNRIYFAVSKSEFNNLKYGVVLNTPALTTNYDVTGSGALPGVLVHALQIHSNYFGAEVKSNIPYSSSSANTSEYMSDAIQFNTPNTFGWAYHPFNIVLPTLIVSNKIDRSFRGIKIAGGEDTPMSIMSNSILIEDDFTFGSPAKGHGISVSDNIDNMAVKFNTLEAQPWHIIPIPSNPTVSLVYCNNNFGTTSPIIECNSVKNGYYGFQFDGQNPNTIWEGNLMCTHFAGLALTNNGAIGTQGSPTLGSGNDWSNFCDPWGSLQSPNQTYCENSDPSLSFLYVKANTANQPIMNSNNALNPFIPSNYQLGPSIDNIPLANRLDDCVGQSPFGPPPSWRQAAQNNSGSTMEDLNDRETSIYPNPTNGQLNVSYFKQNENLEIRIFDLAGKMVYCIEKFNANDKTIDVGNLAPSIYLIVIKTKENILLRNKLILTD
jgi:hypothetical protein